MTDINQNPGCLASIMRIFGIQPKISVYTTDLPADSETEIYPYRARDDFLSPAEHSFYLVLKGVVGERYSICPKVSLADILFVVHPETNISAYNRINRKHVDFLICEPDTMKPCFAIELDDRSHNRPDRKERDHFVQDVFQAAELPLLRVPVQASYNTAELSHLVQKITNSADEPVSHHREMDIVINNSDLLGTQSQPPICPKCGIPMVLRTARNGPQTGRTFYGCSNYPRCREITSFQASS